MLDSRVLLYGTHLAGPTFFRGPLSILCERFLLANGTLPGTHEDLPDDHNGLHHIYFLYTGSLESYRQVGMIITSADTD